MTTLQSFSRAAIAFMLIGLASLFPHRVGAQSASNMVWVADDLTTQYHCRLDNQPCPLGAILSFRQIPAETAMATHQRSQPLHASLSQRITFFRSSILPDPLIVRPAYGFCTNEDLADIMSWSTATGSGHAVQYYHQGSDCQVYAKTLNITLDSGYGYKDYESYVYDGGGNLKDSDNDLGCNALPRSANDRQNLFSPNGEPYTAYDVSNVSLCAGSKVFLLFWKSVQQP